MKGFKIRCSEISQIIGNPKLKKDKETGELSQTAKSYCEKWLKEQLYNRKYEFSTKHTQKGNICEEENIDYVEEAMGLGFAIKNEVFYEDEYITGTPDIILPDRIIDIKSSWDCFTFPLFESKLNPAYWWQGQGYMHLVGKKSYTVAYVLSSTPEYLIKKEFLYYCKSNNISETDTLYKEFKKRYLYDNIEKRLKLKTFDFEFEKEAIEKVKQKVIKCREYIKKLQDRL